MRRGAAALPRRTSDSPKHPLSAGCRGGAILLAAYTALLAGLGTTYEELRLARRADPPTRSALAGRLGLTIDPHGSKRPDALDKLLLDPPVNPPPAQPSVRPLSEAFIERLFGLADTTRNPLSDGPILDGSAIDDPGSPISRWNLTGTAWGINTAQNGKIYVALSQDASGNFTASLYTDKTRGNDTLVASGQQSVASGSFTGPIQISEENSSGLSGSIEIANPPPAANATIELGAVPELASWQLETLRGDWLAEDYPVDPFTDGSTTVAWTAPKGATLSLPSLPAPKSIVYDAQAGLLTFTGVIAPPDLHRTGRRLIRLGTDG